MSKKVKQEDIKREETGKKREERAIIYYGYLTCLRDDYKVDDIISDGLTTAYIGRSKYEVEEQIAKRIFEKYNYLPDTPDVLKSHFFDESGKYKVGSLDSVEKLLGEPEFLEKYYYWNVSYKTAPLAKYKFF